MEFQACDFTFKLFIYLFIYQGFRPLFSSRFLVYFSLLLLYFQTNESLCYEFCNVRSQNCYIGKKDQNQNKKKSMWILIFICFWVNTITLRYAYAIQMNNILPNLKSTFQHNLFFSQDNITHSEDLLFNWKMQDLRTCPVMSLLAWHWCYWPSGPWSSLKFKFWAQFHRAARHKHLLSMKFLHL